MCASILKLGICFLFLLLICGSECSEGVIGRLAKNYYLQEDNNTSYIISRSNCSEDTFTEPAGCTLSCVVYCPGNHTDVHYQWNYFSSSNSDDYYPITTGTGSNNTNSSYTLTLKLKDYHSGNYTADFACSKDELSYPFHIYSGSGSPIGAPCSDGHQCLALNSVCAGICQCPSNYPIQKTPDPYTSSCLPEAELGSECMFNIQCQTASPHADCIRNGGNYGLCICDGDYMMRYIEELGRKDCILFEGYMGDCEYDEQCNLFDEHLECNNYGHCDCEYGYYYDWYYYWCEYNPWTTYLSITATIGIVFGVIFLVILIFVGFALCIRSKRPNIPPPPMNSDQFSTFTEPSALWTSNVASFPMDTPPNYMEAGGLDSPPPPFDSEVVIKTRLEDPPEQNFISNDNQMQTPMEQPFEQQPPWYPPRNLPPQIQHQQPDLLVPQMQPPPMHPPPMLTQQFLSQQHLQEPPPTMQTQQFLSPQNLQEPPSSNTTNDLFVFENPQHHANLGFEADC